MPLGRRSDPYMGFRFLVEIKGIAVARFSEVSGLQIEIETETYEEGGVNDFIHYFPKRAKYQNLILKRGITDGEELWKWHQDVVNGIIRRKNGYIILLDSNGEEKWRWYFIQAFPVKWSGPELKADSSNIAFETIELVHQGIKKG